VLKEKKERMKENWRRKGKRIKCGRRDSKEKEERRRTGYERERVESV
jgi:hypothetical protein